MKNYATYDFYIHEYSCGVEGKVDVVDFDKAAVLATSKMRHYTFGRIDCMKEIPYEVQACCCELVDKMLDYEKSRSENGMVLQSYSNDGESGTFFMEGSSEQGREKTMYSIIYKWLSNSGLMYCGG